LNTDYTVSLTHAAPSPGSITLTVALPVGTNLLILRQLPFTQLINISDNSATPASTWNQGYDRACMIEQQLQEQLSRSILASAFSSSNFSLPAGVANNLIGWDATASTLVNYVPNTAAYVSFPVSIAQGGTGSTTKTFASSGANSDITSLSGLTTALSAVQGGTGSSNPVNGASGVVVLDSSSRLPPVNGSQLTGLSAFTTQFNAVYSKGFNSVYYNSTGKTMFVVLSIDGYSGTPNATAKTDSSHPPTTVVGLVNLASTRSNLSFMVLSSNYYEITDSNSDSIANWTEWY
jgi:hypothetical protein